MRVIMRGWWVFLLGMALLSIGCREVVEVPTSLSYGANPAVYTVGTAIPTNSPTNGGGKIDSYSVSPVLPDGLNLDTTSGAITGTPTLASSASTYTVTGTNTAGSTAATLSITVNAKPPAILITTQPASQSILVGETATFTVVATGTGTLTYQWAKNGVAIPSATSASYTTPAAVLGDNGSTYAVDVSDDQSHVLTSNTATLTVAVAAPSITISTQPASQSILVGGTATFTVVATGTGPLTYQWSKDGTSISGATSASYTTSVAVLADSGSTFSVAIHNTTTGADLASASATLTVLAGAGPGIFTSTTGMSVSRVYATATLLSNGKVLVAAGYNGSIVLSSAELFDPASESFATSGSLATPRQFHAATLLAGGQVLVTGGSNLSTTTATAERFDPATGAFTATGSMIHARADHSATLLPGGKVLIVGGGSGGAFQATAELYDPATGIFTATANAPGAARAGHSATLLGNGKVLIVGGRTASFLSSAELYDPALGTFTPTGGMALPRAFHTATLLASGKVLVVGGAATSIAEIYDPATGTFATTMGNLGTGRSSHSAALLPTGKVLIAGGSGQGSPAPLLSTAELYDPVSDAFTSTGSLNGVRKLHMATTLGTGKVLVLGGYSGVSFLASAELYN